MKKAYCEPQLKTHSPIAGLNESRFTFGGFPPLVTDHWNINITAQTTAKNTFTAQTTAKNTFTAQTTAKNTFTAQTTAKNTIKKT